MSTMAPFFSIITASLNNADTIRHTLESVLHQNCDRIEHIVIDGNSHDKTCEILKKYSSRYNLKWISENDRGLGDALNKGLKLARGTYLLILQADDKLYTKNCLSDVQRFLQDETYDIYSFPVLKEYSTGEMRPYMPIRLSWWYRFKTIFPHQGCFVHRRLYDSVGTFRTDLQIGVDYDFFYRAMQRKPRVKYGTLCVARMGGDGMSSREDMIPMRLREEFRIQQENEKNVCWQILQRCFWTLYVPYKTLLVPSIKQHCVKFLGEKRFRP